MTRVRRFRLVLTATSETIADGAWFAVDESVAVAYRGPSGHVRAESIDDVTSGGRLASHVEWDDQP